MHLISYYKPKKETKPPFMVCVCLSAANMEYSFLTFGWCCSLLRPAQQTQPKRNGMEWNEIKWIAYCCYRSKLNLQENDCTMVCFKFLSLRCAFHRHVSKIHIYICIFILVRLAETGTETERWFVGFCSHFTKYFARYSSVYHDGLLIENGA